MVLEKIKKLTTLQWFRAIILGKERPNLLTRISLIIAFLIWVYLFSWQLLTLVAILFSDNLAHADGIKAAYHSIGKNKYGFIDGAVRLKLFTLVQLGLYLMSLVGLVFVWRQKRWGFILYLLSYMLILISSLLIMGWTYIEKEIPLIDLILIGGSIIYFAIGLFIFGKAEDSGNQGNH
jgi:hypothetical protein